MKRLGLLFVGLAFSFNAMATPRVIPNAPVIAAKAYLLVDFDSGKVLAEHNSKKNISPCEPN